MGGADEEKNRVLRGVPAPLAKSIFALQPKTRLTLDNSLKKIECVYDFASQKEEEDYYALKIQEFHEEMRDKFGRKKGLTTKNVTKRCSSYHDEEYVPLDDYVEKKKKKKKEIKLPKLPLHVVATTSDDNNIKTNEGKLRQFIKSNEINGTDIRLLIQKKLFESDLKSDQNRLNMPSKSLKTEDFLKPEEKQILDIKEDNGKRKGIEVGLVGPKLQLYKKTMVLKLWEMRNNKNYVLMTNWNDFVADNINYLQKDREIKVWSFRRDEQLCFAISIV